MNPTGKTIYIVEDDPSIRFGLQEVFEGEGYNVASSDRGDNAETEIAAVSPDVVLLDVMLPGKNGYEICRNLREAGSRLPILMLTAKGQEIDKVVGLDCGADDYVTKPFSIRELTSRVNALLRRCELNEEKPPDETFRVGEAEISVSDYQLTRADGGSDRLTPKEMDLLRYFHQHRNQVLTRDTLLEAVWGVRYFGTTRALDQCIAQLRKKIGDAGSSPRFLKTVHGVGYRLDSE